MYQLQLNTGWNRLVAKHQVLENGIINKLKHKEIVFGGGFIDRIAITILRILSHLFGSGSKRNLHGAGKKLSESELKRRKHFDDMKPVRVAWGNEVGLGLPKNLYMTKGALRRFIIDDLRMNCRKLEFPFFEQKVAPELEKVLQDSEENVYNLYDLHMHFKQEMPEYYLNSLNQAMKKLSPCMKKDEKMPEKLTFYIHDKTMEVQVDKPAAEGWLQATFLPREKSFTLEASDKSIPAVAYICRLQNSLMEVLDDEKVGKDVFDQIKNAILHMQFKQKVAFKMLYDANPQYPNIAFPCLENSTLIDLDAHHIDVEGQKYIAIHDPARLKSDMWQFWEMIHLKKSDLIVKLNQSDDGDYWPTSGETMKFDEVNTQVTCLSAESLAPSTHLRVFEVSKPEGKQIVKHIEFDSWPDGNAPSVDEVKQLLEKIDLHKGQGPITVHCGAGQGRTGTLIAAHALKKNPKLDLFDLVDTLRKQRPEKPMVETPMQFAFLDNFKE